ncbi:unnamed protein product [Aphanomyces euteiches]
MISPVLGSVECALSIVMSWIPPLVAVVTCGKLQCSKISRVDTSSISDETQVFARGDFTKAGCGPGGVGVSDAVAVGDLGFTGVDAEDDCEKGVDAFTDVDGTAGDANIVFFIGDRDFLMGDFG